MARDRDVASSGLRDEEGSLQAILDHFQIINVGFRETIGLLPT